MAFNDQPLPDRSWILLRHFTSESVFHPIDVVIYLGGRLNMMSTKLSKSSSEHHAVHPRFGFSSHSRIDGRLQGHSMQELNRLFFGWRTACSRFCLRIEPQSQDSVEIQCLRQSHRPRTSSLGYFPFGLYWWY